MKFYKRYFYIDCAHSVVNLFSPEMETQVLIPQEFSLVLTAPGGKKSREQVASVFSTVRIPPNTMFYPFQGTVRIDKLEIHSYLDEHDVSNSFHSFNPSIVNKWKILHLSVKCLLLIRVLREIRKEGRE